MMPLPSPQHTDTNSVCIYVVFVEPKFKTSKLKLIQKFPLAPVGQLINLGIYFFLIDTYTYIDSD